jgi:hypothetical protein
MKAALSTTLRAKAGEVPLSRDGNARPGDGPAAALDETRHSRHAKRKRSPVVLPQSGVRLATMLAGIACGPTGSGAGGGSITCRRPPVTACRGGSLSLWAGMGTITARFL